MSVAVCIHKYITNRYIQSVTCTVHRLCLMLSEIISWNTKVLLIKNTSILPFATWREQGRRESTLTE